MAINNSFRGLDIISEQTEDASELPNIALMMLLPGSTHGKQGC